MHEHARQALEHAHEALHGAQANTEGLTEAQQESLSKAGAALEKATKKVETEQLESAEWMNGVAAEAKAAEQSHAVSEHLKAEIEQLKAKIVAQGASEKLDGELKILEAQMGDAEVQESVAQGAGESMGKLADELEKLQRQLETMEDIKNLNRKLGGMEDDFTEGQELHKTSAQIEDLLKDLQAAHGRGEAVDQTSIDSLGKELQRLKQAAADAIKRQEAAVAAARASNEQDFTAVGAVPPPVATHAAGGSLEINTEMPYGELEPFGREDTAAELTAASIQESDKMVDTIERAEIAEEKRAVFRSLTRLRGAAITSFDGVARAQTGNIDEYAHTHQWRGSHPLHHLADEESDVSKWAFPKNAD